VKQKGFWKKKSDVNAEGIDGYDWDESQPKWPLTRILKWVGAILSAVVWILVLWRIFSGTNAEFEHLILLDAKAAEKYPAVDQTVVRIYSENSGDETAETPLVDYPVYLDSAENLQLTLRINRRTFPEETGKAGYRFILRRSGEGGTFYHGLSYFSEDDSFQYRFYRLCFNGVPWEEGSVYTLLVFPGDYEEDEENLYPASKALFTYTVKNEETYIKEITPKESEYEIYSK